METDDTAALLQHVFSHPEHPVEQALTEALMQRGRTPPVAESLAKTILANSALSAVDALTSAEELLTLVVRMLRDQGDGEVAERVERDRGVLRELSAIAAALVSTETVN